MNASATGTLDQYGVVGHPVAHSWSPFIHGLFSRETGQSMSYRLYDFNPEEFHALLIQLDGDVSREECLLDFDVADTEGDGYIGFKEFVVWWTS